MKIASNIIDLRSSSDTKSIILGENKFINIAGGEYEPYKEVTTSGGSTVTKAFFYDEVYNKPYDKAGTGELIIGA